MTKQLLNLLLGLLLTAGHSYAQEAIYFANGDKLPNARLTDATEQKVVFTVPRNSGPASYTFQRTNVLMAFNAVGDFLAISALSPDAATARQQIERFATATMPPRQTDLLVKAVPLLVIPATISYESDEVVNYQTAQGTAASISKAELVMILRKDGRHQLQMAPIDVVSLLPTIRQQQNSKTTEPVVAQTPAPATPVSPAPVAIAPTTTATQQATPPTVVVVVNNLPVSTPPTEPVPTNPAPSTSNDSRPALSESDYQAYRVKALRRVDEFSAYLNVITNKRLSTDDRDQAIEQASRLFMPGATIEVTSSSRPGARRYPIRDYLTRLKLLPYSRADIEWSEIQYVRELMQAADGNYYGTITGQQTFTGYGAGGQNVLYSDVTQKNVRVKLQSYQKLVDGQGQVNWEVLLGNIGVANN